MKPTPRATATACVLLLVGTLVAAAGCQPSPPPPPPAKLDTKPTLSMAEVVERINRNNRAIPTLWSQVYIEGDLVDARTKESTFVNLDGAMLYRAPHHFRLTGEKLGNGFEVGTTDEHYWLKTKLPGQDRMYFGETRHLGKPCVRQIPIQPDLLLEVLGVGPIDTDFLRPPSPVMLFNPDMGAYMFFWVAPTGGGGGSAAAASPAAGATAAEGTAGAAASPGEAASPGSGDVPRLVAQRQIWYDRTTFLPRTVILSDANGRPLVRALLDNHKPVVEGGPMVATRFRLLFPDTGSTLRIDVEDMALSKGPVPKTRGIVFPGADPAQAGVQQVIKLDKDCKD